MAVSKTAFDSIESVLKDVRAGKMVIVTDDAERENEGDLVMAASKVTPEAVNFMAKNGRGLICVPLAATRARQLGLQRMVAHNRELHRTDFTVSVDAAKTSPHFLKRNELVLLRSRSTTTRLPRTVLLATGWSSVIQQTSQSCSLLA
jgi:hypothetical protein